MSLTEQYQDALRVSDPAVRSRRLAAVAEMQHEAGDLLGSESSLAAASDAAHAVSDPASRAIALIKLAGVYVRLEQGPRGMQTLLAGAGKAADEISDADAKVPVLADLAVATGQQLKDVAAADAYLTTAEDAATSIALPLTKVTALAKIAGAYGKIEQPADAERLVAAALDLARNREDPRTRCDCLAEIAAAQYALKLTESATATFLEAEQAAAAIAAPDSRAYALLNLAEMAKSAGRPGDSQRLLGQAEEVARTVRDPSIRNPLLDEIGASLRGI
jgi:hypothetical protein